MAADADSLSRKVHLHFWYLIVTNAANFESKTSQIQQMPASYTDFTEQLLSELHHLSFHTNNHQISAFFTFQFNIYFQVSILGTIQDVHDLLLADTFEINQ